MKVSLKILLLSTLTAVNGVGASTDGILGIISLKCTPLYRAGIPSTISFDVKATKIAKLTVMIDIINDSYLEGINIYTNTFISSQNVVVLYDNEYTRISGNVIRITQKSTKGISLSTEYEINFAKSQYFNLDASIYSSESNSFFYIYESGRWLKKKEKITFFNFQEHYMPNYYHLIDISNFSVTLDTAFDISKLDYDSAVFAITNKNGIFDSFEHDNNLAYIPLTFVKENKQFVLNFSNDMYVNPLTLEMSATYKSGFVKTKYFYLPRNEKRYEETYDCYISLKEIGIDKSNYVTSFKYKSLLNTFGDCRNSEYCIVNS